MVKEKNLFQLGFEAEQAELNIESLPIEGSIPEWLSGTLIRNGPGRFQIGSKRLAHWFDGLAMLHTFSFDDGKVAYKNRFLDCAQKRGMDEGRIDFAEFATDPCRSWFAKLQGIASITPSDSAKISVGKMGDRFIALGETPIQVEFDPKSLESVGVVNYDPKAIAGMPTAHPHFDADETTYNLVTTLNAISFYKIMAVDPDSKIGRVVASAPVRRPAYLHSFAMTPNYFVISEFPYTQNTGRLLLWNRPYIENFKWHPGQGTRFWVFERKSGKLISKLKTDPFFAMHHINAFEADGEIVIDLVTYEDSTFIDAFYLNRIELGEVEIPEGALQRFHLNLATKTVTSTLLSETRMELNHIDYTRDNMRPDYRFVYGIGISPHRPNEFYNRIVKVDIATGESKAWDYADQFPGEPVFVPRTGRQRDDDGLLLSVVLDRSAGNSYLLILDALDLTEIGRAYVPYPMLFGYHGNWYDHQ